MEELNKFLESINKDIEILDEILLTYDLEKAALERAAADVRAKALLTDS